MEGDNKIADLDSLFKTLSSGSDVAIKYLITALKKDGVDVQKKIEIAEKLVEMQIKISEQISRVSIENKKLNIEEKEMKLKQLLEYGKIKDLESDDYPKLDF